MPAISRKERDVVARESIETVRMACGPTAPASARSFVRGAMPAELPAERLGDLTLMTSELVTNAVEYSGARSIDLAVAHGRTFTRISVSVPDARWKRAPESHAPEVDQTSGWGLFVVEQLSDRWGTRDADCTVWFELDRQA